MKNFKLFGIIFAALVVVGIGVSAFSYFTGDSYKYKIAMNAFESENYDEAYKILAELGDYMDSDEFLPFHGSYTDISVGDERRIEFDNGVFTETFSDTSSSEGTYILDGYASATLENDDANMPTDVYKSYKNYIYESGREENIFDEKIDISKGFFNGKLTEKITIGNPGDLLAADVSWEYIFEDDGTYVYYSRQSEIGSDEPYSTRKSTGTYSIDGDLITLVCNEDESIMSYLVIDGTAYRSVYVKD